MKTSFCEWLSKHSQFPHLRQWAERLEALGASWETFKRENNEIVDDLVQVGGIPILAARDIVKSASEFLEQQALPTAVFWDLESIPIPPTTNVLIVARNLKQTVCGFGHLTVFHTYGSALSEHQRAEMETTVGCEIVEIKIASNKIAFIADVVEFALSNPKSHLCLITGNEDHSYLLSTIQRHCKATTVVGTSPVMSAFELTGTAWVNWEVDILPTTEGMKFASRTLEANGTLLSKVNNEVSDNKASSVDKNRQVVWSELVQNKKMCSTPLQATETTRQEQVSSSTTLPSDELRSIIKSIGRCPEYVVNRAVALKVLRTMRSSTFPSDDLLNRFLDRAIANKILFESGDLLGLCKTETAPTVYPMGVGVTGSKLLLTDEIPSAALREVPERVTTKSKILPYVLLVPRQKIPTGFQNFKGTLVQSTPSFLLLMFPTVDKAQQVVSTQLPQLSDCKLVDWRNFSKMQKGAAMSKSLCNKCRRTISDDDVLYGSGSNGTLEVNCSDCFRWSSEEKAQAVARVIVFFNFLEEYEDMFLPKSMASKQIWLRYSEECLTRKHATLWLSEAIETNQVIQVKRGKNKVVCLPHNAQHCLAPPLSLDTTKEENFVVDLLWRKHATVSKKEVLEKLKTTFPHLKTPLHRTEVLRRGQESGKFHVARAAFEQVVGLTEEETLAYLGQKEENI